MKAFIVSDLHWDNWKHVVKTPEHYIDWKEKNDKRLLPDTDVIIVAGDIASTYHDWCDMVRALSNKYKQVILVLGNHDITCAFGDEMLFVNSEQKIDDFKKYIKYYPNVHLLDGQVLKIGNTTIGGCMGIWDSCYASKYLYRSNVEYTKEDIRNIILERYKSWFDCIYWKYLGGDIDKILTVETRKLERVLKQRPDIMVTHFCPFPGIELIPEQFREDLNSCFFYFDDEKTKDIKMWVAGHVHTKYWKEGKYRNLFVNTIGYPNEVETDNRDDGKWIIEL